MADLDIRAFLKAEIAKRYRQSRGLPEGHIPSAVVSEAFADEVLDIPQIAGMIAGQEIDWTA
jgi:hypothetical protein